LAERDPGDLSAESYLAFTLQGAADAEIVLGDYAQGRIYLDEAVSRFARAAAPSKTMSMAKHDLWLARLRLAAIPGSGVTWSDLAADYPAVAALGQIGPADRYFLNRAKR
jgi:hypothetical protein